jgi:hypothetical protein
MINWNKIVKNIIIYTMPYLLVDYYINEIRKKGATK